MRIAYSPDFGVFSMDRQVADAVFLNFTGHPAASIPAGHVNDLPVGMQLIGRRYGDTDVLAASAAYERLRPWHQYYARAAQRTF